MLLQFARDNGLILDAGSAAITTSAAGSVAYIDLGANYANFPLVIAQINVSAIKVADTDETYTMAIQTSDTTNFAVIRSTSNILLRATDSTAVVGAYFLAVNPRGRYLRFYTTNAGTSPSVTFGGKIYANTYPGS